MLYNIRIMTKNNLLKIIVIVGPTASGKSDLAIGIARKYDGEIISADSRQVYTGMNLGTGKVPKDSSSNFQFPRPRQRLAEGGPISNFQSNSKSKTQNQGYYSNGIKHHLIDAASPKKQFTALDFKKLGTKALFDIARRAKIAIVVGGTGFYIDILLGRMAVAQVPPNKKLRAKLEKQSAEQLFNRLSDLDPQRAESIDRYNKRRLMRALEIILITGKPISESTHNPQSKAYNLLWIGLKPKNLEKRIKKRLDQRLKIGMVKEVEKLHKQGVDWKRLDAFGLEYRWISRWLIQNAKISAKGGSASGGKGFKNSDEYKNLLRDIIKYSKRQMTWFKRNKEIHWLTPSADGNKTAKELTGKFLN